MTVVLDTNVLVSALIHPGSARFLIYRLVETNVNIAISDYIIKEAETVLKRSKFRHRQILTKLWEELKPIMIVVNSKNGQLSKLIRDPKDRPILITAQKARADYLITGDDDLLTLKKWRHTKIITIAQYQKLFTI
jgi:putative PIN family toxin of toxin-antitoxin system